MTVDREISVQNESSNLKTGSDLAIYRQHLVLSIHLIIEVLENN